MIDLHCHILPDIDDGPETWESTLEMCELAAADGVTHIVATPHCNRTYLFRREVGQSRLEELQSRFTAIEFSLGCEMTLGEQTLDLALRHPEWFTIGETGCILVELNEAYRPKQIEDALGELISSGFTPILAHPERSPLMKRRLDLLEAWISMGCLSAVTGNSLAGFWGTGSKKAAEAMLRAELTHFLVSDGHDPQRRPPVLSQALVAAAKIVGYQRAHELVWDNPSSIVKHELVPA